MYSFGFLLGVTILSSLLYRSIVHALVSSGLGKRLPALFTQMLPGALSATAFAYLMIRVVYSSSLSDFGVQWLAPDRPVIAWCLASSGLVLIAWTLVWLVLFAAVPLAARRPRPDRPAMTRARLFRTNPLVVALQPKKGGPWSQNRAYVLYFFFFVGLVEEPFGRGFLQTALDRGYAGSFAVGPWAVRTSTCLASVLFAVWHINWIATTPQGAFRGFRFGSMLRSVLSSMTLVGAGSFVLCFVYQETHSLVATIVVHNVVDAGKLLTWYAVGRLVVDRRDRAGPGLDVRSSA